MNNVVTIKNSKILKKHNRANYFLRPVFKILLLFSSISIIVLPIFYYKTKGNTNEKINSTTISNIMCSNGHNVSAKENPLTSSFNIENIEETPVPEHTTTIHPCPNEDIKETPVPEHTTIHPCPNEDIKETPKHTTIVHPHSNIDTISISSLLRMHYNIVKIIESSNIKNRKRGGLAKTLMLCIAANLETKFPEDDIINEEKIDSLLDFYDKQNLSSVFNKVNSVYVNYIAKLVYNRQPDNNFGFTDGYIKFNNSFKNKYKLKYNEEDEYRFRLKSKENDNFFDSNEGKIESDCLTEVYGETMAFRRLVYTLIPHSFTSSKRSQLISILNKTYAEIVEINKYENKIIDLHTNHYNTFGLGQSLRLVSMYKDSCNTQYITRDMLLYSYGVKYDSSKKTLFNKRNKPRSLLVMNKSLWFAKFIIFKGCTPPNIELLGPFKKITYDNIENRLKEIRDNEPEMKALLSLYELYSLINFLDKFTKDTNNFEKVRTLLDLVYYIPYDYPKLGEVEITIEDNKYTKKIGTVVSDECTLILRSIMHF